MPGYVLPFRPLGVYSGHDEGIYLSTDEGLWVYDPETGHAEIKWRWNDEYMNVDYRRLRDICCGDGEWYLMCPVPGTLLAYGGSAHRCRQPRLCPGRLPGAALIQTR